jgi:hypothetical protein
VVCATGRGGTSSVEGGPEALSAGRQRAHLLSIAYRSGARRSAASSHKRVAEMLSAGDTSCGRAELMRPVCKLAVEHAEGGVVHR